MHICEFFDSSDVRVAVLGLPDIHLNSIVIGSAGVGKSFLIRALEIGIFKWAQDTYGPQKYPDVRSVVRLAAFTGKAAYQVGGVTLHSLLKLGNIHNLNTLQGESLRRL